tara:strand:+ start:282 stop:872 length:591 start_codon:yes stop_codon:yes gene_type:complete
MIHSLIKIFLISSILYSKNQKLEISDLNWNILHKESILIEWSDYENQQWCKAQSVIGANIDTLQKILENKENYPTIFKRIERCTTYANGNVHIVLDMPFPFYGRDYIVKYTQFSEGGDIIYKYSSVKNSGIPVDENYVRLINAAGEWRLHPINSNNTEVTYIWNGELGGDFPEWALTRAWLEQGKEVLNWLKSAVE